MRYLLTTLLTFCILLAHSVQAQEETLLKLRDDDGTIYKAKGRLIGNVEKEPAGKVQTFMTYAESSKSFVFTEAWFDGEGQIEDLVTYTVAVDAIDFKTGDFASGVEPTQAIGSKGAFSLFLLCNDRAECISSRYIDVWVESEPNKGTSKTLNLYFRTKEEAEAIFQEIKSKR